MLAEECRATIMRHEKLRCQYSEVDLALLCLPNQQLLQPHNGTDPSLPEQ